MIRAKGLFEKFNDSLEEEVDLGKDPSKENNLHLNDILPVLYKKNKEIHKLQQELSIEKDYSIEDIKQTNESLSPAEKAVELLLECTYNYLPYLHVAAKVTDAGDKLDKIILKEIKNVEKKFRQDNVKLKKWKNSYGLDRINPVRNRLNKELFNFNLLKNIYKEERKLPEKAIKSAEKRFEKYSKKLEKIKEIKLETKDIVNNYRKISTKNELKDFFKDFKKELDKDWFSKSLMKRSIKADYKENTVYLKELKKDMKYVLKNFNKRDNIIKIKSDLKSGKSDIDTYSSRISQINENNLKIKDLKTLKKIKNEIDAGKFNSINTIYLEDIIEQYRKRASSLLIKNSKYIRTEKEKLINQYEQIESKSRKAKDNLNDFKKYSSFIEDTNFELDSINDRFKAIGDAENSKKAVELRKDNKYELEEIKSSKKAIEDKIIELRNYSKAVLNSNNIKELKKLEYASFKDISFLEPEIEEYDKLWDKCNKKIKKFEENKKKIEKIKEKRLEYKLKSGEEKKKFIDNVVFPARDGNMYDVRNFIEPDDTVLKAVIQEKSLKGKTLDETAYNCMRFVQDNIEYSSDAHISWNQERWLTPAETLHRGSGDCEDGANLMISLMRNADIPAERVRNVCGLVETEKEEVGGHSWPIYNRETDNEWVNLDWCYYPSDKPISERLPADKRKEYKERWFSFNDEHSWKEDNLTLSKEYKDAKKDYEMEGKIKDLESEMKSNYTPNGEIKDKIKSIEQKLNSKVKEVKKEADFKIKKTEKEMKQKKEKIVNEYMEQTYPEFESPNSGKFLNPFLRKFKPSNQDYYMLGDILLGNYQKEWKGRITALNEEIEGLVSCRSTPSSDKDVNYLKAIGECIKSSLRDGELRDKVKNAPVFRRQIYQTLSNLDEFVRYPVLET